MFFLDLNSFLKLLKKHFCSLFKESGPQLKRQEQMESLFHNLLTINFKKDVIVAPKMYLAPFPLSSHHHHPGPCSSFFSRQLLRDVVRIET